MVVVTMRRCTLAPPGTPLVTPKYGVARAHENKLPCIMLCVMCVKPSRVASVSMYCANVMVCYVAVAEYYAAVAEY